MSWPQPSSCITVEPLARFPVNPRPPLLLSLSIWPGFWLVFCAEHLSGTVSPTWISWSPAQRLGDEASTRWEDSWAQSLVDAGCQENDALCLLERLPLWLPRPMSTCHAPVDHQLFRRKLLQSCDDLIWLPYRPQNMIPPRSLWVLQIYWQRTFYTQDKLLIIKQTCFSVPGPYFMTDGSQPSGLATQTKGIQKLSHSLELPPSILDNTP